MVLPVAGKNRASSSRRLLSGLSGFAEAGRIMAVMGTSGSGKSTFLDSLSGRLSPAVTMTGNILINGKKRAKDCKDISYVTQEDIFLGTLTVRETITYSARLRLPSTMSRQEINQVVDDTIMQMGLHDCADSKIGNWHLRGLSGGEKKRLSISLEIVTHPQVLFLDEPTTGLDSAAAFFVVEALRNIAHDGRIVVCTIHQPSSDVFNLFDDLLLISSGETVYFGEAKSAVKFFADAGFPCPRKRNPSDHFLRCISLDFDIIREALIRCQRNLGIETFSDSLMHLKTAEIRAALIEKFKNSNYCSLTRRKIHHITLSVGLCSIESTRRPNASWWEQLNTLTLRSFLNMYRDIGYYWLRIIFYVLVAVSVGVLYLDIGHEGRSILARGKCVGFVYGFMICLSVGGLPFFIEEMKVFKRERIGGHYGDFVFVLSNFLSSFPFLVVISVLSGTIIYYMVKFHPGFSNYGFFCINLFCCISVIEACMMVVASLVPNLLMGIGIGTGIVVLMMMASEISRPLHDIPKIFWRYPMSYISFASWAVQGQLKNDMIGQEFDPLLPGDRERNGEILLQTVFGVPLDHSKWTDLGALVLLSFSYRILFYIVLRYTKPASSLFHGLFSRRTHPHQSAAGGRTPSLRRDSFISSKRHKPLYPLSSLEGAASPPLQP